MGFVTNYSTGMLAVALIGVATWLCLSIDAESSAIVAEEVSAEEAPASHTPASVELPQLESRANKIIAQAQDRADVADRALDSYLQHLSKSYGFRPSDAQTQTLQTGMAMAPSVTPSVTSKQSAARDPDGAASHMAGDSMRGRLDRLEAALHDLTEEEEAEAKKENADAEALELPNPSQNEEQAAKVTSEAKQQAEAKIQRQAELKATVKVLAMHKIKKLAKAKVAAHEQSPTEGGTKGSTEGIPTGASALKRQADDEAAAKVAATRTPALKRQAEDEAAAKVAATGASALKRQAEDEAAAKVAARRIAKKRAESKIKAMAEEEGRAEAEKRMKDLLDKVAAGNAAVKEEASEASKALVAKLESRAIKQAKLKIQNEAKKQAMSQAQHKIRKIAKGIAQKNVKKKNTHLANRALIQAGQKLKSKKSALRQQLRVIAPRQQQTNQTLPNVSAKFAQKLQQKTNQMRDQAQAALDYALARAEKGIEKTEITEEERKAQADIKMKAFLLNLVAGNAALRNKAGKAEKGVASKASSPSVTTKLMQQQMRDETQPRVEDVHKMIMKRLKQKLKNNLKPPLKQKGKKRFRKRAHRNALASEERKASPNLNYIRKLANPPMTRPVISKPPVSNMHNGSNGTQVQGVKQKGIDIKALLNQTRARLSGAKVNITMHPK